MNHAPCVRILFVALVVILPACSGREPEAPNTATVSGRLTLDGTPLPTGAAVVLHDAAGSTIPLSVGSDGTFTKAGVPHGSYKVSVRAGDPVRPAQTQSKAKGAPANPPPSPTVGPRVPQKYLNHSTSGIEIIVPGSSLEINMTGK